MASAETLTTLRDRVELFLQDPTNLKWSADQLDEAIEDALQRYSRVFPQEAIGTITLAAAGREITLATLTGWQSVRRVWWDYDAASPGYPPKWRDFEVWPGEILYIKDQEEPSIGDVVRVWYTKPHTLNLLAGATATTFPQDHEEIIITGSAALAAYGRTIGRSEKVNVDSQTAGKIQRWAQDNLAHFDAALHKLAAESAARASGIAPGPALDRWDTEADQWR
jgi:hypothetical protein